MLFILLFFAEPREPSCFPSCYQVVFVHYMARSVGQFALLRVESVLFRSGRQARGLSVLAIKRRVRQHTTLRFMSLPNRRLRVPNRHSQITTRMSRALQNRTNRTFSGLQHETLPQQIRGSRIYTFADHDNFTSPPNNVYNGRTNILRTVILYVTCNVIRHFTIRLRTRCLLYVINNNRTSNSSTTMNVRRRFFTNRVHHIRHGTMRRFNLNVVSLVGTT